MNIESSGQVALLVDFENLIGNDESYSSGESHANRLIAFAKEYGRVVISKAYANWNHPNLKKYQHAFYKCGIDTVQVLSKKRKNSVDIKLAVDAVDMMHSLSHINVFIMVSSDKGFTHLYKILRAQGKIVVVVAFDSSFNLKSSCDHFILYKSIVAHLTPVKKVLQEIMAESPHGIDTITLKQLLRQKLSPNFDEHFYGYEKFSDLLGADALEDVVVLKKDSRNPGSPVLVYPASAGEAVSADGVAPEVTAPDAPAGEAVSADGVAPEVTAPGTPAAEGVSADSVASEVTAPDAPPAESVSVDSVSPAVTAPDATTGEAVSADSVALEVTAPDAPPAEDVFAEDVSPVTSSYTTEDK